MNNILLRRPVNKQAAFVTSQSDKMNEIQLSHKDLLHQHRYLLERRKFLYRTFGITQVTKKTFAAILEKETDKNRLKLLEELARISSSINKVRKSIDQIVKEAQNAS